jgi:hypothetical protein
MSRNNARSKHRFRLRSCMAELHPSTPAAQARISGSNPRAPEQHSRMVGRLLRENCHVLRTTFVAPRKRPGFQYPGQVQGGNTAEYSVTLRCPAGSSGNHVHREQSISTPLETFKRQLVPPLTFADFIPILAFQRFNSFAEIRSAESSCFSHTPKPAHTSTASGECDGEGSNWGTRSGFRRRRSGNAKVGEGQQEAAWRAGLDAGHTLVQRAALS